MIFPSFRRNRELDRAAAEVMRPGWLRAILMLALFIAIGAIYWRHFDNKLADIQAQSSFWDETKTWTDAEKRALARRAIFFREQWGIKVVAHARTGPLELPKLTKSTLFLGTAPERGEAMLVLPGLAAHVIKAESARQGRDIRLGLEVELGQCLRGDQATAACLNKTLDDIQALLAAI